MDDSNLKHGAFSWNELMTTDVDAATKFYAEIFGWESEDYPMEGMTYRVLKVNGEAAGGIMRIPEEAQGMPPMWTVYVTVDDCDATANKIEELGGKILRPPTDIPKIGRFCVLQDPTGGVLCAIKYAEM
jgi:predicted enzyme related to lactoylglutathione lyase